jgi:beta-mannosidase
MIKNLFLLILVTLTYSCKKESVNVKRLQIDNNWELYLEQFTQPLVTKISLPSTVHSAIIDHTLHPFKENNEERVQWVSAADWTYKTTFKADDEILKKEFIKLHFEGIDTYATIMLNGDTILKTDNAFLHWQKEVKPLLKKQNELVIRLHSPLPIEKQKAAANPYELPMGNRVYTRKAQFQYGWDWAPTLNNMGIIKPVYIEAFDQFKIEDVYIKQNFIQDSIANLTAQIKLSKPVKEPLTYQIKVNDSIYPINITDPYQQSNKDATQEVHFEINQVQLWWPHNIGNPYLYKIELMVFKEGKLIDTRLIKKGIRTIELINKADEHGKSFFFKVNGVSTYMKGANYIPQNSIQDLVTDRHYEKLLNDAVSAHMNMLRVWGGGAYENDIFYEKCDEKGILVWQDFMFACAMYPGDSRFRESVTTEIKQQITRLRNHSSIALWCGNNETREAWSHWGWQNGRSTPERNKIWEDYRAIFQITMPKYVSELTKEPYWESTPEYGRGNPKYKTEGDAHDWNVWHDTAAFEHFEQNVPRFMSEFGFQAHPSYESIKYINKDGSLHINSTDYASHQKHDRGNNLIKEYMQRDFIVPKNDADYVYVSQLLQAYGMSQGFQAHRRSRPYNMGTLYWQLNDCWPVVSWSGIDYFGNWKALHYQAKRDFKNLLISNTLQNDILKTYIVNDHLEDKKENFEFSIKDFYGNLLHREFIKQNDFTVNALSSNLIQQVDVKQLSIDPKKVFLITKFGDEEVISFLEKPKNLLLPEVVIDVKISPVKNGFQLEIKSDHFAKNLFLHTDVKGHFTDNFFDLPPGAKKTIVFETTSNVVPLISYKTLNGIASSPI